MSKDPSLENRHGFREHRRAFDVTFRNMMNGLGNGINLFVRIHVGVKFIHLTKTTVRIGAQHRSNGNDVIFHGIFRRAFHIPKDKAIVKDLGH